MQKVRLMNMKPGSRFYGKTTDLPESVLNSPKVEKDGWVLQGYLDDEGNIISKTKPGKGQKNLAGPDVIIEKPKTTKRGGRPKGKGKVEKVKEEQK